MRMKTSRRKAMWADRVFDGLDQCRRCGDDLIAPVGSAYVTQRRIKQLWNCDACGHEFETMVFRPIRLAPPTKSEDILASAA
jgi:ribosomal protein L37AE/L43A